ncbi:Type I Iterative PKS [Microsporum audouinii]
MPVSTPHNGFTGDSENAIAVLGLDLKFPGDATDPTSFFDMLLKGRSALSETPKDRYNLDAFYHPDPERAGAINIRKAHYVRGDLAAFDAPFFNITPAEAACMDPQQRGLLESVFRALENAGIPLGKATGTNTSVYIGCFTREYDGVITRDPEIDLKYIATGTGTTMISNRISWFYDLRGASMTLDTACSSSLMATHLACSSLRNGESSMSIVGGCNLFYNPDTCIPLTSLGFLSPDSKCYSFDHRANGYSRGEGFGILILKRLNDAINDGDTIRAVIRSTAANQDGRSPGITQPTKQAQVAVTKEAYKRAHLDPSITRYFESHGTGTPVGDPIEASAIAEVFAEHRSSAEPLYVGALKSNIGHLEGAAGIAGLMKAILVLESGIIPPNVWFEKPNSKIEPEWNLNFPTHAVPWPTEGLRRASVNGFGYGGSNAHVVLDDAYHYLTLHGLKGKHCTAASPRKDILDGVQKAAEAETSFQEDGLADVANGASNETMDGHEDGYMNGHISNAQSKEKTNGHENGGSIEKETIVGRQNVANGRLNGIPKSEMTTANRKLRVFILSAFDEGGIERLAKVYREHLISLRDKTLGDEEAYLDNLAYTLASKRTAFPWRSSAIANSLSSLIEALGTMEKPFRANMNPRLALIFTGQGAQWYAMGHELLVYSVFENSLRAATDYFHELGCHWSLYDEYLKDEESSSINDPEFSQPICTALQIAIVDLLASWEVSYHAVVGHSSGEIAAAYAAGAISRASAWRLAYHRGALSASLCRSKQHNLVGMLSVGLNASDAQAYVEKLQGDFDGTVTVACINSPKNVTLSGSSPFIDALKVVLDDAGIFARRLQVENAYHSAYMEPIAADYRRLVGKIKPGVGLTNPDAPRFYSSTLAKQLLLSELQSSDYWVSNLTSPVRFSEAVTLLLTEAMLVTRRLGSKKSNLPISELLEVGPHATLRGPIREVMDQVPQTNFIAYGSVLKRNCPAVDTMLEVMAWLHCRGHAVRINTLNHRSDVQLLIDLPSYPFNHSRTYWNESRLSKGYRFRQFPRHELLGAPVPDWDRDNAIWRNWIRVSENPWIADHRVTGSVLYPAAGMLVMAIEASRQLLNPSKEVKAFLFREVSLHMALKVPLDTDGVETHFHLRPYHDSTSLTSSSWNEFVLRSHTDSGWVEHCRGLVQTEYKTAYTAVDNGKEDRLFAEMCVDAVKQAEESCQKEVVAKQLYEILQTVGFDFGPTFQNLSSVRINDSRHSVATISTPDIKSKMPYNYIQPHLIHPTTLDGCFQSVVVAMTRGGKDIGDIMVPVSFKELWIDAEGNHDCHRVQAHAQMLGLRQAEADFVSIDPASQRPLVMAKGFISTAVAQRRSSTDDQVISRHLCFNTDWKADPSFITQDLALSAFPVSKELLAFDPTQLISDIETLSFVYMKRYMRDTSLQKVEQMKPHHQRYVAWIEHQFERYESEEVHHIQPGWKKLVDDEMLFEEMVSQLEHKTPEATLTVAVGRSLRDVLENGLDPLQVLFHEKRAENVYRAATGATICYERLSGYIEAISHKNPSMKILEVGAGTGGMTRPVLEALARHGDHEVGALRFSRYDFTDISPSFFEKAREVFDFAADRMTFQIFNVENDPAQQGFDVGQYDLILAANVFHATKSIDGTLQNVQKLLKPGGKLILYEITNADLMQTGFGFGLLPGWWLSQEQYRKWSPLLSVPSWSSHLERNGFVGIDLSFPDYDIPKNHVSSLIIATASSEQPQKRSGFKIVIVASRESEVQQLVAGRLHQALLQDSRILQCEVVDLNQFRALTFDQKLCIFLAGLDSSFLLRINEEDLHALQRLTTSASCIFWPTVGGGPGSVDPQAELVTGFARSMRAENATLRFVTLTFDEVCDTAAAHISIHAVFRSIFLDGDQSIIDNTFAQINGVIHIPRIIQADYMSKAIQAKTTQPIPHISKFGEDPARALKLVVGSPGLLDTLHFTDDPLYEEPLIDGEVEFKVMASGLNFLDIMVTLGQVIGNQIGIEAAGIVTRTGPSSRWKAGDRVAGMLRGSLKTFARTVDNALTRVPHNVSWTSAATIPVVFVTAYCALYQIADIKKGETVLIHAAAGGVGQACIQLAQLRGAEVYATVGSIQKAELLQEAYGIHRDHIFSSRDLTFAKGIKRMTQGKGVDVVVNALSGAALRATWDCIAAFGRFVEIGKIDIFSSARLSMEKFKCNVRFEFLDVCFMGENDEMRFKNVLAEVMRLFSDGAIKELQPVQAYTFSQIQEAFRYMQSGAHSGKLVLEPHDDDEVMMLPSLKPTYSFDPNATYVIAGGTGGLGRSMARWMARRGAKNLILLSRSGASKDTSRELIEELEVVGVNVVATPCDVCNAAKLKMVIDEALQKMPPIKGCIQGSMVLKDAIFANMSLDDYYTAVKPKVQGSWNLHAILPKNLDFFILLSSGSGIVGKGGQSNYCIGNTYQDALARYRVSHGLKATALDLGIILSVGYAAEKADVIGHLRAQGYAAMREEEYHAMLDQLCDPNLAVPSLLHSQISLGFELPEALRVKGVDMPGWMHDPLFSHLHQIRANGSGSLADITESVNYGLLLAAAETREAAEGIITDAIVQKLSKALGIESQSINPSQPLHAYGVDSLVAVELRTWILKELSAEVAVFDMVGESTIRSLGAMVAARSSFVHSKIADE